MLYALFTGYILYICFTAYIRYKTREIHILQKVTENVMFCVYVQLYNMALNNIMTVLLRESFTENLVEKCYEHRQLGVKSF